MVRVSRKGMSPLIATVLLMAFAVALGGMVMTWGQRMIDDPTQECAQVKLDVAEFCLSDEGVRVHAFNSGEKKVESLTVQVVNANGAFPTKLAESTLDAGQRMQALAPILIREQDTVRLMYSVGNEDTMCPEPQIEQKPLSRC